MVKSILKTLLILFVIGVLIYAALISFPNLLFKQQYIYKNFRVFSDKEIPSSIESVLDQANTSLMRSELYDSTYVFKIVICHNQRLFGFLTRNKNAGGVVQGVLSPTVILRESNISRNQIIPPGGWMYDMEERPLSYFIAHESTHSLQAEQDRFMILKVPTYVMEGYADYIGKNQFFNYQDYRTMLIENHPKMRDDSPLYSRYHLYISYLIEKKGMSFLEIIENVPDLELVLQEIKNSIE